MGRYTIAGILGSVTLIATYVPSDLANTVLFHVEPALLRLSQLLLPQLPQLPQGLLPLEAVGSECL